MDFEKQIAYFFAAPEPDRVAKHYLDALVLLEESARNSSDSEIQILDALGRAYAEVAAQTTLSFDVGEAAAKEYELMVAEKRKLPFEDLTKILVQLYKVVFGYESPEIQKAAMLRVFLYRYKSFIEVESRLSVSDKELLLNLARTSEKELGNLKLN